MTEQQINDMVSRFLAWRLPENFSPDGGISFAPTYNTWGGGTARAEPVGTNLFSFDQAKAMVLHIIGDPSAGADPLSWAVECWHREVFHRPLTNVYRRVLDDTWRQVIRHFGGDPDKLIGPDHDTLTEASHD